MSTSTEPSAGVVLYWIPLGAGASVVRTSGRVFEAVSAAVRRRHRCDLYHSALEVVAAEGRFVIEMAPVVGGVGPGRGAVADAPVGMRWAGRLRVFRYEIRCWRDGVLPDAWAAVGGPITLVDDPEVAQRIVDLVPSVPTPVWGRDELRAGEMWNSNSVISWLLTRAGVDTSGLRPPRGGRAPGWDAGRTVAGRAR